MLLRFYLLQCLGRFSFIFQLLVSIMEKNFETVKQGCHLGLHAGVTVTIVLVWRPDGRMTGVKNTGQMNVLQFFWQISFILWSMTIQEFYSKETKLKRRNKDDTYHLAKLSIKVFCHQIVDQNPTKRNSNRIPFCHILSFLNY